MKYQFECDRKIPSCEQCPVSYLRHDEYRCSLLRTVVDDWKIDARCPLKEVSKDAE